MVVISPSTEADLRSIKENIASDGPAAAIKWLDGIHKTFAMIDMHPEVGEHRTEFSVKGCRSLTYGRYAIFSSLPGAADITYARMIATLGDDRTQSIHFSESHQTFAGTAS